MKKLYKIRRRQQALIAKERIEHLFNLAENVYKVEPKLAQRYIFLARKIAMKSNVRFTKPQKRRFCKNCNSYLKPGYNCSVRTKKGKLVYNCKVCGKSYRMPYLREKRSS